MKLVTYIENQYQELTLKSHNSPQYALWIDAEIKALHAVLTGLRVLMKWVHIFLMPFKYLAVLLHVTKAPTPILVQMAAQQKAAEAAAKAMAESVAKNVTQLNAPQSAPTPVVPA